MEAHLLCVNVCHTDVEQALSVCEPHPKTKLCDKVGLGLWWAGQIFMWKYASFMSRAANHAPCRRQGMMEVSVSIWNLVFLMDALSSQIENRAQSSLFVDEKVWGVEALANEEIGLQFYCALLKEGVCLML